MTSLRSVLKALLPVVVVGLLAHYALANPEILARIANVRACEEPITYAVRTVDPRFAITRAEVEAAVEEAAAVWNTTHGKLLLASSTEAELFIDLVYDERQEAIELGVSINEEQEQYQEMRDAIESLRSRYATLKARYEAAVRAFERDVAAYETEVARWNEQGGAPPAVYAQLAARKAELSSEQSELGSQAAQVESIGRDINTRVVSLNALVVRLNENAETFNETLGHDFDQGNYVSDDQGERITIYTFERRDELVRVLAHEFGHALGIGHVENPDSLMYSYNIGTEVALSEEDRAALVSVCSN